MASLVLSKEVENKVKKIQYADIVVGIPSFENGRTIEKVVSAAGKGLARYFPDLKAVLVNVDGGSNDDTRKIALATRLPKKIEKIITLYSGPSGKGSALRTIFGIAEKLNVKMCLTLDADTRSVTPEWIEHLASPLYYRNFGFVTPYYLRDKHDGTITNSLVYPLTRALYGPRIRQPIGGDFGLTSALVKALFYQKLWNFETDIARFGIDIWMTTTAINEGFRVCQASLGVKIHDHKKPEKDVTSMFKQVAGTMFGLMGKYETKWRVAKITKPVEVYGEPYYVELEEIKIALPTLINDFRGGFLKYEKFLRKVLSKKNFSEVSRLTKLRKADFYFPVDLWAKVVYDFAVAYNLSPRKDRDAILSSFLPLYMARTAAFVVETLAMPEELAEAVVEGVAAIFERLKPYLLKRWDETLKLKG